MAVKFGNKFSRLLTDPLAHLHRLGTWHLLRIQIDFIDQLMKGYAGRNWMLLVFPNTWHRTESGYLRQGLFMATASIARPIAGLTGKISIKTLVAILILFVNLRRAVTS